MPTSIITFFQTIFIALGIMSASVPAIVPDIQASVQEVVQERAVQESQREQPHGSYMSGSLSYFHPNYADSEKKRTQVAFQYATKPLCNSRTTTDDFSIDAGDGGIHLADCSGTADHAYAKAGTYTARYLMNGIEIARTKVIIEPTAPAPAVPALPPPVPVTLTLPKQGTSLCRNTFLPISWQGDPNTIDELRIWLDNTMVPTGPLYQGPLLYNEYGTPGEGAITWRVGTAPMGASLMDVPDGQLYRIKYEALYQGNVVYTNTSGTFAIQTCAG